MKLIKNASGKKVAKMSKREWTDIGIKQGWFKNLKSASYEKKAQADRSMADQIGTAFEGLGQGIQQAGQNKVQEYAQRIMNGEPKEQLLQGMGPAFIQNVENELAKQQTSSQTVHPKIQEYVQRIINGEPKEQIMQGLPPGMKSSLENELAIRGY